MSETFNVKSARLVIDDQEYDLGDIPIGIKQAPPVQNFEGWGELRSACGERAWGAVTDMLHLWHPRSADAAHSLAASLGWIASGMDARDLIIADEYELRFDDPDKDEVVKLKRIIGSSDENHAHHYWEARVDDFQFSGFRMKFDGTVWLNATRTTIDVDGLRGMTAMIEACVWIAAVVIDRLNGNEWLQDNLRCPLGVSIEAVRDDSMGIDLADEESYSTTTHSMTINGVVVSVEQRPGESTNDVARRMTEAIANEPALAFCTATPHIDEDGELTVDVQPRMQGLTMEVAGPSSYLLEEEE